VLHLPSLGISVPLAELFANVELPDSAESL
jgi:hypothetical protein